MCDIINEEKCPASRIALLLNKQRKTGEFCDIKILINRVIYYAHSAVMINFSEYIKSQCLLNNGLSKNKKYSNYSLNTPLIINLNSLNSCCTFCVKSVLNFMYLNLIDVTPLHLEHLTELCTFLKIDNVVSLYLNSITQQKASSVANNTTKAKTLEVVKVQENLTTKVERNKINIQAKKLQCKLHKCLHCNFQSYKPSSLLVHLKSSNSCQSQKICSLCLMQFDSNDDIATHLSKHDHPKPFFCTSCDQRFQSRTTLSQHIPKHSQETPFVCPHCRKGFKWKHGLTSHLIIHSKEMKHLCDECGFSTAHAKTLRAHKLIHTGDLLQCPYPGCKHKSQRKENLKSHITTHNKETPFVCEICGHKFSQSKNLKRHSRIHDPNLTHHQCPHRNCYFKSPRTDKLREHILRQHSSKSATSTDTQKSLTSQLSMSNNNVLDIQQTNQAKEESIIKVPLEESPIKEEYTFITFSENLFQIMDNPTNIYTVDAKFLTNTETQNEEIVDIILEDDFPVIDNEMQITCDDADC